MTETDSGRKSRKSAVVAIKVEAELAEFLDGLPNKSEFIRRAIYSQLGVACPLCHGSGSVSRETHDQYEGFIKAFELRPCECCGNEFPVPRADVPVEPHGEGCVHYETVPVADVRARLCRLCQPHAALDEDAELNVEASGEENRIEQD